MAKRRRQDERRGSLEARLAEAEQELARLRRGIPAMQAIADLLHTFPGPLALEDAEGRLLRVSESFAHLLGHDSTVELRGKRLDELFDGEQLALLRRGDETALQEGRRYTYEMRWQTSEDAPPRYFSVVKIPLENEVGERSLLIVFMQEITPWWQGLQRNESYLTWWNTISDFVHIVFSQEKVVVLLEEAARWITAELGYECVAAYLFDEEQHALVRSFASSTCEAMRVGEEALLALSEGENWLVRAFTEGMALYRRLPDGDAEPLTPLSPGSRVAVALPLRSRQQRVGILLLASQHHRGLDEVAIKAMNVLSIQLALAINTVTMQERVRRSMEVSTVIAEATRKVEMARSYEELLQALVPFLRYLGLNGITLRLLGRRERDVYLVDIHSLREVETTPKYSVTRELPVPRSYIDTFFQEHDYLFYSDVNDPKVEVPDDIREQMQAQGLRASVTFPLRVRGRLIGLLVLYGTRPLPHLVLPRLFVSLRDIVTYSVDRMRLFRQMEETIRQRELLYSALAELSAASSYEELLEALRKHTFLGEADRNISINRFDRPWTEEEHPEWSIVLARWTRLPEGQVRTRYPLHIFPEVVRVLSADAPTIVEDVASDPRLSPVTKKLYRENFQAGSTIFFPLVAGGRWIGYVNAIFSEPRRFPIEEVRTTMTLVNQAAVIIQSLSRMAEMERRAQRLFAAAEVSRAATAITDLETLLFRAVELIQERFDLYYAGIFLVDEKREWAILRAGTGEAGRKMLEAGHRLRVGGQSMIGACVATGEARIALDVGREAVRFNNPLLPKTRSEMALPLRSGGEIIGAMTIQSTEEAAFSEEDIVVLQTMADQLANAIQVSRLLRSTERNLKQLRAAYGEYTLEAWRRLVERAGEIGYRYRGLDVERVQEKEPQVERAWREGRPIYAQDERTGEATVAVPIKLRDRVIGVISMRSREGKIAPDAVETVEAINERLAMALETTRLLEETRRSVMREQLVAEIGARIRGQLEIESVLETALRELGRVLNAQRAEARLTMRALHSSEEGTQA